jgi:hypothetical protein
LGSKTRSYIRAKGNNTQKNSVIASSPWGLTFFFCSLQSRDVRAWTGAAPLKLETAVTTAAQPAAVVAPGAPAPLAGDASSLTSLQPTEQGDGIPPLPQATRGRKPVLFLQQLLDCASTD